MSLKTLLKDATFMGVRELRSSLSEVINKSGSPVFITIHGKPQKILMDYEELLELLEIYEELQRPDLLEKIAKARAEYRKTGGVPFRNLSRKLRIHDEI
ncbi:MAG: hypothetical protein M1536_04005 [Firmicutes bacterium]|nr:hypothetical protein [Bacillota bacterium]